MDTINLKKHLPTTGRIALRGILVCPVAADVSKEYEMRLTCYRNYTSTAKRAYEGPLPSIIAEYHQILESRQALLSKIVWWKQLVNWTEVTIMKDFCIIQGLLLDQERVRPIIAKGARRIQPLFLQESPAESRLVALANSRMNVPKSMRETRQDLCALLLASALEQYSARGKTEQYLSAMIVDGLVAFASTGGFVRLHTATGKILVCAILESFSKEYDAKYKTAFKHDPSSAALEDRLGMFAYGFLTYYGAERFLPSLDRHLKSRGVYSFCLTLLSEVEGGIIVPKAAVKLEQKGFIGIFGSMGLPLYPSLLAALEEMRLDSDGYSDLVRQPVFAASNVFTETEKGQVADYISELVEDFSNPCVVNK